MNKGLDQHIFAYSDEFDYSFDNDIILKWYPRRIMALTRPDCEVLELGIGHGYTCNLFSEFYSHYSVIDGSKAVINQFEERYPDSKAQITESYFENYQSDRQFDIIIMGFVLEHVENPSEVLKKFKRYIRPRGRCFIAVPNAESLHRRFGHEAGFLPDIFTLGQGDRALGHRRLYTVATMNRELNACGYRIIRHEGIFLKPFTTNQLVALRLDNKVLEGMCTVGVNYPELCAGLLFEATVDN